MMKMSCPRTDSFTSTLVSEKYNNEKIQVMLKQPEPQKKCMALKKKNQTFFFFALLEVVFRGTFKIKDMYSRLFKSVWITQCGQYV